MKLPALLIYICFLIITYSCSIVNKEEKTSIGVIDSTIKEKSRLTPADSNFQLSDLVDDISFDIEMLKKVNYGNETLSDSLILFTLFPSNQEAQSGLVASENENVSVWKCNTCKPIIFEDRSATWDGNTYTVDTLPYPINFTKILSKHYFKGKTGLLNCLVSFSTAHDDPTAGRFESGLLNLALFQKEKYWKLMKFNPFVNYQGSFQTPHDIDTIVGNTKKWAVIHGGIANGPAAVGYCPFYLNLYFTDLDNLKQSILIEDADCWNDGMDIGSQWKTTYTITDSTLQFITTGFIDKENLFDLSAITSNTKHIWKKLPRQFNFTIERNYVVKGNEVYVISKKLKIMTSKQKYEIDFKE